MELNWKNAFVLTFILMLGYLSAKGTHLRAGNISIIRESCSSNGFKIVLVLYADAGSLIKPGSGELNFGDGTFVSPNPVDFVRGDLPNQVSVYTLEVFHTYTITSREVMVSYREANRNASVLNIANSLNTAFYIESSIFLSPNLCNSNPILISPPVDVACHKITFQHSPAAFDGDGDSLSYQLAVPKSAQNSEVGYTSPDNQLFYSSGYETGSENGLNRPVMSISPVSGMLVWDSPGAVGEYNIAFIVNEWRRINGSFVLIGFVRRDMQIIVKECNNAPPEINPPLDVCIYAGETLNEEFIGLDSNGDPVKVEFFSGVFDLNSKPTIDPATQSFLLPPTATTFEWTPDCSDVRNQPYQVVIKITDKPANGNSIARFRTWNIRVAAPAPDINEPVLDAVVRRGIISWSPYLCSNASKIVIWRRVGRFNYVPDKCVAGLPAYAGYTQLIELSPNQTSFVDDNFGQGLAPGATYCYRITAVFPLVGGAESEVSIEKCLPPVLAEAPVITKVSVTNTSKETGTINLQWYSPYDLDPSAFEGNYEYQILRSEHKDLMNFTPITTASIADTSFVDRGLNTESFPFAYRIILLARNLGSADLIPIDTSAIASSVWNRAVGEVNAISISWTAEVPWSNTIQDNPLHLIYRQEEGSDDFVLIGSVNVVDSGFHFTDHGTFSDKPLKEKTFYCYKVLTRGTYGNPAIESPLENFSQIACSTTFDDTPPCTPFAMGESDCSVIVSCNQEYFSNQIIINSQNATCIDDVYYYKIYTVESDTLQVLDVTFSSSYIHANLTNRSLCYQISTVDRAGNESPLSEKICFDNCPSVFFPNVFTPNEDEFNPIFTTINQDPYCTRFVERISLKILNRWGQTVANIPSTDSVKWDGKDNNGRAVDTGIYYFIANIEFQVREESDRFKEVKGWVHVVK